jgi:hypothetical protein
MHQVGIVAQFQHVEHEEFNDEAEDLMAVERSPEDAGYSPPNTTTKEGESLSQLFENICLIGWETTMSTKFRMKLVLETGLISLR